MRSRLLAFVAAAVALVVTVQATWSTSTPTVDTSELREGDLIFRAGDEAISAVIRVASGGGQWSHVGILSMGQKGWEVVHAIPEGSEGKRGGVTIDTLDEYLARSRAAGVFRAPDLDEPLSVTASARALEGVPFGTNENGKTNCTELVLGALAAAGVSVDVEPTHYRAFNMEFVAVLPQQLASYPRFLPVK